MPQLEVIEASEDAANAAKKPKGIVAAGAVGGALVAGAALGMLLLGPMFGPKAPGDEAKAAESKSHGKAKGEGGHGSVIELENMIVNPAGSEGVHFLMLSIALEVHSKEGQEFLQNNEHLLKDAIQTTLSRRTLEQLCEPNARDGLKQLIAADVDRLLGEEDAVSVYLPEFVVQ